MKFDAYVQNHKSKKGHIENLQIVIVRLRFDVYLHQICIVVIYRKYFWR